MRRALLLLIAIAVPAGADTLTFYDDFETGPEWGIFEEIVGPCYDSGIGEVVRDTSLAVSGTRSLRVWAGKVRGDSSNHVIGQRRIANYNVSGLLHYEMAARMDSDKTWGQTGPEFSIQITEESGPVFLTSIAGIQYLPWSDSWQIWDSGVWRTFTKMPLASHTWYHMGMRADFTGRKYDRLWVRGGSIDTVIPLGAYTIAYENKGFTDSAVWLTLEAQNLWTNCQWDTDFRVAYDDARFYPAFGGSGILIMASDTRPSLAALIATADSFAEVHLSGGTTSGSDLRAGALTGADPDYALSSRLLSPNDTFTLQLWTNESAPIVFVGLRSDSAALVAPPAARDAFAATVLMTEFAGTSGIMIGDTATTSYLGDSFAYNLVYELSEATALLYRNQGFDTAPGSTSFRFYYADTYGGSWTLDTTVTVTVAAGTGGGIRITVAGITKDLPGGLGGMTGDAAVAADGGCIIARLGLPSVLLDFLRALRDGLMSISLGRAAVGMYYALS